MEIEPGKDKVCVLVKTPSGANFYIWRPTPKDSNEVKTWSISFGNRNFHFVNDIEVKEFKEVMDALWEYVNEGK